MFNNSSIFNVPFKDNCSVLIYYFNIQYSIHLLLIQVFLVFIILRLSKLIPILYQSPNSIDFE